MKMFTPGFAELNIDIRDIYRGMGQADCGTDENISGLISGVIEEMAAICRPLVGYKIFPLREITGNSLSLGGVRLKTGSIITSYFTEVEWVAVFVATCGPEMAGWLCGLKSENDIFREYVADAVGSEIAEAAAHYAEMKIGGEAALMDCRAGNSYSPGYCGWHVRDQKVIFSLLPPGPCGITLNDSCLMTPVKSVSGIIGIGKNVRRAPYGCEICDKKDCYKKRIG